MNASSPNGSHLVQVTHLNVTLSKGVGAGGFSFTETEGRSESHGFLLPLNYTRAEFHAEWAPTHPTNEELRVEVRDGEDVVAVLQGSSPMEATWSPADIDGKGYKVWPQPPQPAGVTVDQTVHVVVTVWGPR